jgi:hypothetical protein
LNQFKGSNNGHETPNRPHIFRDNPSELGHVRFGKTNLASGADGSPSSMVGGSGLSID